MTENKEHQAVTRGIKHWGLSGYASVLPRIKFGVAGQDSSPQSPTISYRQPFSASLKATAHLAHFGFPTAQANATKTKKS